MTLVRPDVAVAVRPRRWQATVRLLARDPQAVIAITVLTVIVLCILAAPLITGLDPNSGDITRAFAGPAAGHPFGFDSAGRDVLARLLQGGRTSLGGALLAVVVAFGIGAVSGLVAGYRGGITDQAADWTMNLIMAMPAMIVLLAARSVLGSGTTGLMLILGIIAAPAFFRVVRGVVTTVRKELYVDAARVAGLSDARIIRRHILAVVRGPVIIQIALVAGIAISLQAGLQFLGIGGGASATWGGMLSEAFGYVSTHPAMMLWPGLALGLTNMSLVLLASSLRDALERSGAPAPSHTRRLGRRAQLAAAQTVQLVPALDATGDERSSLLSIRGLRVAYDQGRTEVVHGIDLDVYKGSILGLVGESGSGKSQTAFSTLGILPDGGQIVAGSVRIDDREIVGLPEREMRALRGGLVGYVPQEPMSNLDPCFTVGQHLIEPLRVKLRLSRREARARAVELLRQVEIRDPESVMRLYPHQISGGMAQRVLIAGAISCDPSVLIADEPTTALDVTVQAEILRVLRRLRDERGLGVLLVTHNLGVVADLCDEVAVMQDGRIVETGSSRDVLLHPRNPYTQRLVGAILDGTECRPSPLPRLGKEASA